MDVEFEYEGKKVTILDGPYTEDGRASALAMEHLQVVVDAIEAARRFAAGKLLATYNDSWLDDGHGPLDEAGFVERLTGPSVTLMDEIGAAELTFGDSDMFGGHYVQVSLDGGRPTYAELWG